MDFTQIIGLGIAGNFTGHLEQAGEAEDFSSLNLKDETAPKGIFPFYVPNSKNYLGTFPLSNQIIHLNKTDNLQVEPELAILCNIEYESNLISQIIPTHFTAYNDCSIRNKKATKISQKKNWGENSKGISTQLIPINQFNPDGKISSYRIASYLLRDKTLHEYGINSPINGYSYFYQKLLRWIENQINTQTSQDPLESILNHLETAKYPSQAIISVGATRYTKFGEETYLQEKDEIFVIIYDSKYHKINEIEKAINNNSLDTNISVLHQKVNK